MNTSLPYKDVFYIKNKIINKVKSELKLRIDRGYKNINLEIIEEEVNKVLRETRII